jgi:AbrB family looped-hinge helix DNA binding protein
MKTITQIDASGRLVIPKELRERYGFEAGQQIRLIPGADGLTLVPERTHRRFIKRGPILTIDTGIGTASLEVFDVSALRRAHLRAKGNENRRR